MSGFTHIRLIVFLWRIGYRGTVYLKVFGTKGQYGLWKLSKLSPDSSSDSRLKAMGVLTHADSRQFFAFSNRTSTLDEMSDCKRLTLVLSQ